MQRNLEALTGETFDLLIIGGGITGAGVALDAATRGLRVALIDKGDFASGTSSVSSKLIHGGLRYLEHGQIALVWEALHERAVLLRNAPHLVQPLRFIIPFFRASRVPWWKWRIGLTLYDLLAGAGNIRRSRPLSSRQVQSEVTDLQRAPHYGGVEYFDAQMDDARLCLAVLKTAARHGAILANYVEAVHFERGSTWAVRALDCAPAPSWGRHSCPPADKNVCPTSTVRARLVLNAAGPWADAVSKLAGDSSDAHLQPTKGVHIIVPSKDCSAALLLLHPRDGRVFFVIPWLGKTLIGTTDTFTAESPDELEVTREDVAYLKEGYDHYFQTRLTSRDVLGSFAGLRPLLRARSGQPSALSREFRLIESASGMLTALGGKYTTYRAMAERITDVACRRLGMRRRCRTMELALAGAPSIPWQDFLQKAIPQLRSRHGLSERVALHLLRRYGEDAMQVAEYAQRHAEWAQPICPGEPDICAELEYQRAHEMALCPADHFLRRTRLGLWHSNWPATVGVDS
ncbi:MAG: glycerol-3-phosphate dehydrogenase [Gemmataceae bacterium]|nr:glycerol-3-phosphate dehydrogenase [Gemmataceae bacterium]MCI0741572.1 glycerol-3-phosphate dehydrogenase [Gemmataceae bacterium]